MHALVHLPLTSRQFVASMSNYAQTQKYFGSIVDQEMIKWNGLVA